MHDFIDAVAEAGAEVARAQARLLELVDQSRQHAERVVHLFVPHDDRMRKAEQQRLARLAFAEQIAAGLRLPSGSAQRLIAEAEALTHELPGTMSALRRGEISLRHAQVIIDESWQLGGGTDPGADAGTSAEVRRAAVEAFEEATLPAAMKLTVAKFSRKARQLRERTHPETIQARRVKAAGDREFSFEPSRDGMAYLTLYTEAPLATAIHDRVTAAAMAQQRPEEPRTLTQLRADVATELLLTGGGGAGGGGGGGPQEDRFAGIRPTVFVTVPVLTLLGHSDEPATLDGYGPIDPDTARRLTAQAPSLFRLLTDPETGDLLALSKDCYRLPRRLRRFLRLRDETCRFPGCNRKAVHSDLDHTIAKEHGGPNTAANLAHLCRKHHRLKHLTGWSVEQLDHGVLRWTSPTGHQYTSEPELRLDPARWETLVSHSETVWGPGLLRLAMKPGGEHDEELARQMVADVTRPERGVLPHGNASIEERFGGLLQGCCSITAGTRTSRGHHSSATSRRPWRTAACESR